MMTEDKLKDIILTMIENKMLDSTRIFDKEYVLERVNSYIKSANMVRSIDEYAAIVKKQKKKTK